MDDPDRKINAVEASSALTPAKYCPKQISIPADTTAMVLFEPKVPQDYWLIEIGSGFSDARYQEILGKAGESGASSDEICLEDLTSTQGILLGRRRTHLFDFWNTDKLVVFEIVLFKDTRIIDTNTSINIVSAKRSVDSGYRTQSTSDGGDIHQNEPPVIWDLSQIHAGISKHEQPNNTCAVSNPNSRSRGTSCEVTSNADNRLLENYLSFRAIHNGVIQRKYYTDGKNTNTLRRLFDPALVESISDLIYYEIVFKRVLPRLFDIFRPDTATSTPGVVTCGTSSDSHSPNTTVSSGFNTNNRSTSRGGGKHTFVSQRLSEDPDEDETREGNSKGSKRQRTGEENQTKRRLACHFNKNDGEVVFHLYCRIGSVNNAELRRHYKEHHLLPQTCDICLEKFDSIELLLEHHKHVQCSYKENRAYRDSYIFEHPRNKCGRLAMFKKRKPTETSKENWWFEGWDAFFPGKPRPGHPYETGSHQVAYDIMSHSFATDGPEVLERTIARLRHIPSSDVRDIFGAVTNDFLRLQYARARGLDGSTQTVEHFNIEKGRISTTSGNMSGGCVTGNQGFGYNSSILALQDSALHMSEATDNTTYHNVDGFVGFNQLNPAVTHMTTADSPPVLNDGYIDPRILERRTMNTTSEEMPVVLYNYGGYDDSSITDCTPGNCTVPNEADASAVLSKYQSFEDSVLSLPYGDHSSE